MKAEILDVCLYKLVLCNSTDVSHVEMIALVYEIYHSFLGDLYLLSTEPSIPSEVFVKICHFI